MYEHLAGSIQPNVDTAAMDQRVIWQSKHAGQLAGHEYGGQLLGVTSAAAAIVVMMMMVTVMMETLCSIVTMTK